MSWSKYRRGRQTVIALPPEVKNQMIRIKARGGPGLGEQIIEALRCKWGWVQGSTQAVTQPALSTPRPQQSVVPGSIVMHNGQPYRLQPVNRPGDPMVPQWRL
jgi:hypothetical protein